MRALIKITTALIFVVSSLTAVHAQQGSYRLGYDPTTQKYTVYGKVTQAYNTPLSRFANIFVTVVVPHGSGVTRFLPANITTDPTLASTNVVTMQRADAPSENTASDYLFFNFDVGNATYTPINIAANTEFPIFSFQNQSGCTGGTANIMDMTTDPFRMPNAENMNAGQAFSILGAGGDIYSSVYGTVANCLSATPQGYYRIGYDAATQKYTVYGKITVPFNPPLSRFANIFVTVVVPHGTGATKFLPQNISTDPALANTNVVSVQRYDAPSENTANDYLLFNFDVGNTAYTPINIAANAEFPIFSFQNQNGCTGGVVNIMDIASDPFRMPNTESINAGQALSVLGAGGDIYVSSYGNANISCTPPCNLSAGTLTRL